MIAYFTKVRGGKFSLTIYSDAERTALISQFEVANKKEATDICKARNITPWNF